MIDFSAYAVTSRLTPHNSVKLGSSVGAAARQRAACSSRIRPVLAAICYFTLGPFLNLQSEATVWGAAGNFRRRGEGQQLVYRLSVGSTLRTGNTEQLFLAASPGLVGILYAAQQQVDAQARMPFMNL